ncbi:MAG: lyase family protein, partial [Acidimicrobiales bacterium]
MAGGATQEPAYTGEEWCLRALSPLDGRYGQQLAPYARIFSEEALIRERFAVEVAWLVHLAKRPEITELGPLSGGEQRALERWVSEFDLAQAMAVKQIEATTNHDVKAVEYRLKHRLVGELGWPERRAEFAHFAATSEDVNNLAYARMVRAGLAQAWLPPAEALVEDVRRFAIEQATQPMLARTHGQPATPTTLGK